MHENASGFDVETTAHINFPTHPHPFKGFSFMWPAIFRVMIGAGQVISNRSSGSGWSGPSLTLPRHPV